MGQEMAEAIFDEYAVIGGAGVRIQGREGQQAQGHEQEDSSFSEEKEAKRLLVIGGYTAPASLAAE
jgi:hypothetical protein